MFVLKELGEQTTRVIERMRADYQPRLWYALLVYLLLEPATFVMERKMLLGIKSGWNVPAGRRLSALVPQFSEDKRVTFV